MTPSDRADDDEWQQEGGRRRWRRRRRGGGLLWARWRMACRPRPSLCAGEGETRERETYGRSPHTLTRPEGTRGENAERRASAVRRCRGRAVGCANGDSRLGARGALGACVPRARRFVYTCTRERGSVLANGTPLSVCCGFRDRALAVAGYVPRSVSVSVVYTRAVAVCGAPRRSASGVSVSRWVVCAWLGSPGPGVAPRIRCALVWRVRSAVSRRVCV